MTTKNDAKFIRFLVSHEPAEGKPTSPEAMFKQLEEQMMFDALLEEAGICKRDDDEIARRNLSEFIKWVRRKARGK